MKQIRWLCLFILFYLCPALTAIELYIDPVESSLEFRSTKLGFFEIEGSFDAFSGVFVLDDMTHIKRIEGMVDVNSINTGNSIRDRALRRQDFFDLYQHPSILFIMDRPLVLSSQSAVIKGGLNIKGNIQEVTIPVQIGFLKHKVTKQLVLSVKGKLTLNRHDFDVSGHSLWIDDDVDISFNIIAKTLQGNRQMSVIGSD